MHPSLQGSERASMSTKALHSIPTAKRPPHGSTLSAIAFCILFNLGIILTNLVQLIFFPLSWHPATAPTWEKILDGTKSSFGQLCVFITERFAPTEYVISGGEGMGDVSDWAVKDKSGKLVGVKLPNKTVWVSNHQTLADWIYIWTFMYLSSHSSSILITLKASVRRIPIIGWACQLYNFIFLSRKWATDKAPFQRQLELASKRSREENGAGEKLALLIFPEGTLVTGNTKPVSEKYAEKIGVPPFHHVLLPRTTGLFFTLRTLLPSLPDLALIDLTIGYPGPNASISEWPEDYYNLTIWLKNVPPPQMHYHVRKWEVKSLPGLEGMKDGVDPEGTGDERDRFDEWFRERWREKDAMMESFVKEGNFVDPPSATAKKGNEKETTVIWPVQLRSFHENFEAFSYFVPVFVLWFALPIISKVVLGLVGLVWKSKSSASAKVMKEGCGCGKMAGEGVGIGGGKAEL